MLFQHRETFARTINQGSRLPFAKKPLANLNYRWLIIFKILHGYKIKNFIKSY